MGRLAAIAEWFAPQPVVFQQCVECGRCYDDHHASCPDCGGELSDDEVWTYHYWEPV